MITIDNKQYRNLMEQVLKNKEDIEFLSTTGQALSTFGIKIVETFETYEQFEEWQETVTEHEYGDAVMIGLEDEPGDLFI